MVKTTSSDTLLKNQLILRCKTTLLRDFPNISLYSLKTKNISIGSNLEKIEFLENIFVTPLIYVFSTVIK